MTDNSEIFELRVIHLEWAQKVLRMCSQGAQKNGGIYLSTDDVVSSGFYLFER
jgi:hypothetical protein